MVVQGREVHDLYIITRGAGDVRVAVPGAPPRVVGRISAPGIFGEMGMLTGEPRRATVVAVGEVECWRLGKERFREVLEKRPAIAEGVSRILATREVELATATEGLSEEARRYRLESEHGTLLKRIERFFGLAGPAGSGREGRTMRETKLFLAGAWVEGDATVVVRSPWDGTPVSRVAWAGPPTLEKAAAAAEKAAPEMAALAADRRAAILEAARADLLSRKDEVARAIVDEAGKPLSLARAEVDRAGDTLLAAAHVARFPELVARDLGGFASGAGRIALTKRVPVGPVLAITPFNFPLNLVAHKLAPAVAAGCPVVLKPASQTPTPALLLAASLQRAGLPDGALSVVPSRAADAEALVADPRFALLTFTGSAEVGFALRKKAWDRRVALELGGNAAVIVEPDWPDLADAARRIANGAFAWAGQSCISVQRVLVHRDVAERLAGAPRRGGGGLPDGRPGRAGDALRADDRRGEPRPRPGVDRGGEGRRRDAPGGRDGGRHGRAPDASRGRAGRPSRSSRASSSAPARSSRRTPRSTRRSRGRTTRATACRRASSAATWRRSGGRGRRSRSAPSSRGTSRPGGATRCPTAASRLPASAARDRPRRSSR